MEMNARAVDFGRQRAEMLQGVQIIAFPSAAGCGACRLRARNLFGVQAGQLKSGLLVLAAW
jgi:hypothetical protein